MARTPWLTVSKAGLSRLVESRPKVFVLHELISNAWDTDTKVVAVRLEKVPNSPKAIVEVVDDDPDGFKNLSHAFTLFAESERKTNAEARGRFCQGEKLVLAICYEAEISTTTGTIIFNDKGRTTSRTKRERGSLFRGVVRMSQAEYEQACEDVHKLIPPMGVETTFNGVQLKPRKPLHCFKATLPTVLADNEGVLRRTARLTTINVYETVSCALLYEMGIPVVETGDKFDVEIMQKVPLNADRDNVTPAYLRQVRTLVLNEMASSITKEDVSQTWVREAASDPDVNRSAFETVVKLRFGEKRAVFDGSDPEANHAVVAQGYGVIYGTQMTKGEWDNLRRYESALPSGRIAPTMKASFSPDGEDNWVPEDKWTPGMRRLVEYSKMIAHTLLDLKLAVSIINNPRAPWRACYGRDMGLVYNLGKLGNHFFDTVGPTDNQNELLIHELGHSVEENHLDERYHRACCMLGAKMARLALTNPKLFKKL